ATRYLLMSAGTFGEDVDLTMERAAGKYEANLANGLGNLVARSLAMAEKIKTESGKWKVESGTQKSKMEIDIENYWKKYEEAINNYKLNEAMNEIWKFISACDEYIEENKPWKLEGNEKEEAIYNLLESLRHIAWMLRPFMPETSDKIFSQLFADEKERAVELSKVLNEAQKWGGMKIGAKIKKGENLFPRL
ncbi:class I tRNA ligase family protein, partial [Patescibacteria group bacterium]|nr:class I tRNA ligase family protein [Patescibacteria group bacterium]